MTIAISLKINDGLVLAADSASTLVAQTPAGMAAVNVYNNANKIINLRKGLPIGAIVWGAGSIGNASISTLLKDLRRDLTIGAHKLEEHSYTIAEVADRVRAFIYDERYLAAFQESPQKPPLGMIVAGYSADAPYAEEYQIDIGNDGQCPSPRLLRAGEESGASWSGEPEPLSRLFTGVSGAFFIALQRHGMSPEQVSALQDALLPELQAQLISPAMPLQDAIDLAKFMVEVTINWSRFGPGVPSVGGPIEIAAISKHEGFRWVQRKYYFKQKLNP